MASTAVAGRAYPKRRRAEISYCENSSSESEVNDEDEDENEGLGTKKKNQKNKKLKTSGTTISSRPLPKRQIFPFLLLPAELKNQIYALALTDEDSIFLISKTKHHRRTVQRAIMPPDSYNSRRRNFPLPQGYLEDSNATLPAFVPNILLLNKAIHAETQPILYAGNTFAVEDTTVMHSFLAVIGPKNRATITELTIKGWGHARAHKALNLPAFTMLVGAVNLTRLHLDCYVAWGGPGKWARQLYRDGFHWFEAVGAAKGRSDAAVDMIEVPESNLQRYFHPYGGKSEQLTLGQKMEDFRAELRKLLS